MKLLACSVAVLLGASMAPAYGADSLCSPLRGFANSIRPGETHEIEFRTRWGGAFNDTPEPNVMSSKRCISNDYMPAELVCRDLLENSSTEFAYLNAMSAIECLSPRTHFPEHTEFRSGEFSIMYGTRNRGANITLTLDHDPKIGGMLLRIVAEGY